MASRYKQTTQTVRTVFREPAPLKGMHYTDTPLDTGLGRVLINFEKNSDDTGIKPRKGAQLLNVYNCKTAETQQVKHLYFSDTLFKIKQDTQKVQAIVRFVIDHYLYLAWQGNNDASDIPATLPIDLNKHLKSGEEFKDIYYTPTIVNSRLVSCVSFESRDLIYAAKLNKDSKPYNIKQYALFKAKANTESIEITDNDVAKIQPKVLNPTEAANWGFNMLLDKPYAFTSKTGSVANQIAFLGFLPYDSNSPDSNVVLNPICNTTTPYIFKLFTEVGTGTYAIRIRWRGVTNDAWENITPKKDYSTTEDKAIAINLNQEAVKNYNIAFNPKQEATIIQIKLYTKKDNAPTLDKTYQDSKYTFVEHTKPPKELDNTYIDSKYSFLDGPKPETGAIENGIYSEDPEITNRDTHTFIHKDVYNNVYFYVLQDNKWVNLDYAVNNGIYIDSPEIKDNVIYKHNDKYGNTYYYERKQNKWEYAAYPTSEDDAEEEIFATGYRHLSTNAMSFNFVKSAEHSALETNNYDIGSAKGLCYWRNRAVAWGIDNALSTIFMSDINDPSYFPFPNNICLFPEPVYYATPFQDDLLVFTKSQIWRVKLNQDGLTFNQTCIQKNLRIDERDMPLTLALSSMVFFKAGPYFYLLVPSSKGTGDLVLAAISRTVEDIFKDPLSYIKRTIVSLYREEIDLNNTKLTFEYPAELIETGTSAKDYPLYFIHTYLDYDKIHIVYSSQVYTESDTLSFDAVFNLVMSYDINLRSWHTWVFESPQVPRLIEQDVIRQGIWAGLSRYHIQYDISSDTDKLLEIPADRLLGGIKGTSVNSDDKCVLDLVTYNKDFYTAAPGVVIEDQKVTINKELVSDMQTFSFSNEQDRRDMLKRFETPNNVSYHCGWAVYSGNDLNSTELYRTQAKFIEPNINEFRYGIIVFGKPTILENKAYHKVSADFVGDVVENFINYTDVPQYYYGTFIDAAPEPMRFYSKQVDNKEYNMFKAVSNNKLVYDPYTSVDKNQNHAIVIRKDFLIKNKNGDNILTHIWYYQRFEQGTVDSTDAKVEDLTVLRDAFFFKNYQYLDTGNRNIVPEVKKKFREYQLSITNKSVASLDFRTEFVVDNESFPMLYNGFLEYKPIESIVKNENNVIIKAERSYINEADVGYDLAKAVEIPGTVDEFDANRTKFKIDNTYYTKPFTVKLRVPTNAKGYLGHLKILSKNQVDYEINDTALIYRLQNAR